MTSRQFVQTCSPPQIDVSFARQFEQPIGVVVAVCSAAMVKEWWRAWFVISGFALRRSNWPFYGLNKIYLIISTVDLLDFNLIQYISITFDDESTFSLAAIFCWPENPNNSLCENWNSYLLSAACARVQIPDYYFALFTYLIVRLRWNLRFIIVYIVCSKLVIVGCWVHWYQ